VGLFGEIKEKKKNRNTKNTENWITKFNSRRKSCGQNAKKKQGK